MAKTYYIQPHWENEYGSCYKWDANDFLTFTIDREKLEFDDGSQEWRWTLVANDRTMYGWDWETKQEAMAKALEIFRGESVVPVIRRKKS